MKSHNQPIADREAELKFMFAAETEEQFADELKETGIDYIYLRQHPAEILLFPLSSTYLEVVYQNPDALVLAIKH